MLYEYQVPTRKSSLATMVHPPRLCRSSAATSSSGRAGRPRRRKVPRMTRLLLTLGAAAGLALLLRGATHSAHRGTFGMLKSIMFGATATPQGQTTVGIVSRTTLPAPAPPGSGGGAGRGGEGDGGGGLGGGDGGVGDGGQGGGGRVGQIPNCSPRHPNTF